MAVTDTNTCQSLPTTSSSVSSPTGASVGTNCSNEQFMKIIDEKWDGTGEKTLYRIRWKGYDPSYDTWEPRNNLGGHEAVLHVWEYQDRKTNGKKRSLPGAAPATDYLTSGKTKKTKAGNSDSEDSKVPLKPWTIADLLKGPTITIDHSGRAGGAAGWAGGGRGPRKASPSVEKATLPEVLAHPDYKAFVAKLKVLKGPEVQLVNQVDSTPSPPIDFEFVSELRMSAEVPAYGSGFVVGCECPELGCMDEEGCGCMADFQIKQFAYNRHGQVVRDSEVAIFECNSKCSCGPDCINRVVQNGRKIKLQIFKTKRKGWAVRSPERLKEGTFVDLYLGEVIGPKEASRRAEVAHELGLSYLFDLDKFSLQDEMQDELSMGMDSENDGNHYTIDGRECGSVARFINHSCDPNLETYAVASDRRDGKVYDLALFTARDIPPYEELCLSYTSTVPKAVGVKPEGGGWPCLCGAKNCVKWLWL